MLNGVESVLHGVDDLIKTFGGLPGVLATIAALMTQAFGPKISEGISNLMYNLTPLSVKQNNEKNIKEKTLGLMFPGKKEDLTNTTGEQFKIQSDNYDIQKLILANSSKISEKDKEILQLLMSQRKELEAIAIERAKAVENAQKAEDSSGRSLTLRAARNNKNGNYNRADFSADLAQLENAQKIAYGYEQKLGADSAKAEQ